jgi:hypothetical protein
MREFLTGMEQLRFTTRVLGKKATARLENYEVTQTLRSESSSIVIAILSGGLKVGDMMQVMVDDRMIGLAQHASMETVVWAQLDQDDARRGGFDNRFELAYALKRAGYRFKDLNDYQFYRIQFTWREHSDGKMP